MPDSSENSPPDPLAVGELISLAEAAEYCGLSHQTLRNYISLGRLRAKKLGSQWITTRAAIDEYLASPRHERIMLQGDMPSPINPPSGCRFHTRCWIGKAICKDQESAFEEKRKGHWVACHFAGQF